MVRWIGKTPAGRAILYCGYGSLDFIQISDRLIDEAQIEVVISLLLELGKSRRMVSDRFQS